MAKITIKCDGIMCESKVEFDIPDWLGDTEFGGDSEYLFCPKCKLQNDYFRAVCPGCVSGYPDCGLGKSFLYCNTRLTFSANDEIVIKQGRCPYRVNGSIMAIRTEKGFSLTQQDISDMASKESADAISGAIKKYIETYKNWKQDWEKQCLRNP